MPKAILARRPWLASVAAVVIALLVVACSNGSGGPGY